MFKIIDINNEIYYLKGLNVRLLSDSPLEDLSIYNEKETNTDEQHFLERIKPTYKLDRNDYFYLSSKILYIDSDTLLSDSAKTLVK